MRRILLVLTLAAVMVTVAVVGSGGALAQGKAKVGKTDNCVKAQLNPPFCGTVVATDGE